MASKKQTRRNCKTRKNMKKSKRRSSVSKYVFKYSKVPPKRSDIYGGSSTVVFPASIAQQSMSSSSYLPANNYNHDPNYLAVSSRNVPQIYNGGRRRRTGRKQRGGDFSDKLSALSTLTTNVFTSQPAVFDKLGQVVTNVPGVGASVQALSGQSLPSNYSIPNRPIA